MPQNYWWFHEDFSSILIYLHKIFFFSVMNLKENLGSRSFWHWKKKRKKVLKNQKGKHTSALTLQLFCCSLYLLLAVWSCQVIKFDIWIPRLLNENINVYITVQQRGLKEREYENVKCHTHLSFLLLVDREQEKNSTHHVLSKDEKFPIFL